MTKQPSVHSAHFFSLGFLIHQMGYQEHTSSCVSPPVHGVYTFKVGSGGPCVIHSPMIQNGRVLSRSSSWSGQWAAT